MLVAWPIDSNGDGGWEKGGMGAACEKRDLSDASSLPSMPVPLRCPCGASPVRQQAVGSSIVCSAAPAAAVCRPTSRDRDILDILDMLDMRDMLEIQDHRAAYVYRGHADHHLPVSPPFAAAGSDGAVTHAAADSTWSVSVRRTYVCTLYVWRCRSGSVCLAL
jgi:hypothetical protein